MSILAILISNLAISKPNINIAAMMVLPVALLWLGGVQAQASDLYQPVNK